MHVEHTGTERSTLTLARKGAVVVAAASLSWFVGVQGLAAIAAKSTSPALLQVFDPGAHPAVGYQLARIYLMAKQPDKAIELARPATFANPMEVRVVRTLGLALEAGNHTSASTRVMRAAEKLSWRDTPTTMWVLRDAALQRDLPRIMGQLDALARRQTESNLIHSLFYAGLEDSVSRQALAEKLANNPPWRSGFFADTRVNLQPQSYDRMEALLDLLDRSKTPPTLAERMTFIARMTDTGQGAKARAYWIRTFHIPPAALSQALYDPAFRAVATRSKTAQVSPFEWSVGDDAPQFVSFRQDGRGYLLDVNPTPDVSVPLIEQSLILAPGTHTIDADIAQGSVQQAPAEWQLTCSPSGTALIRRFATPGNALSGVTITIPETGCDVQTLSLVSADRTDAQPVAIRSVSIR